MNSKEFTGKVACCLKLNTNRLKKKKKLEMLYKTKLAKYWKVSSLVMSICAFIVLLSVLCVSLKTSIIKSPSKFYL